MPPIISRLLFAAVQEPLLLSCGLLAAWLSLLSIGPIRRFCIGVFRRYGATAATAFALAHIALYYGIIAWYLSLPLLSGEVEPTIASVSWLVQQGKPLYHTLESAERYSVLYGPMAFLTNGFFLRVLGPSLVAAKMASTLAAAFSVVFLYASLRAFAQVRIALFFTAFATMLYFAYGPSSYLSRPDPMLLGAVCLGLLAALRAPRAIAIGLVALCAGLSMNLKIHGAIYFVPILYLMLARHGRAVVAWTLGATALVVIAPFLPSNVSATNYVMWLREAARHGLDADTFIHLAKFGLFFSLPVMIALFPSRPGLDPPFKHFGWMLLATSLGLVLFAAKPGAGLVHALPMIPLAIVFTARLATRRFEHDGSWEYLLQPTRLGATLACFLAALIIGTVVEYKTVDRINHQASYAALVLGDLDTIQEQYPGRTIGMAYGGEGEQYELTFFRPSLVFDGHPLLLDAIAVMEGQRSGRDLPERTYEALIDGTIDIWLVPKGHEPFDKLNWYPPHPALFPPEFIETVRANYVHDASSDYFDLWILENDTRTAQAHDARAVMSP